MIQKDKVNMKRLQGPTADKVTIKLILTNAQNGYHRIDLYYETCKFE